MSDKIEQIVIPVDLEQLPELPPELPTELPEELPEEETE